MSTNTVAAILLTAPLLIGGIIAAFNSPWLNDVTERAEGAMRKWQRRAAARRELLPRYVLNPVLWVIVKFCDWTDAFEHRGLKNGARVASAIYLTGVWLFLLYAAVMIIIGLVVVAVILYVLAKVLSGSAETPDIPAPTSQPRRRDEDEALSHVGVRGKKFYIGTNWFTEELKGRVDEDGNIYSGSNWLNEERIGRIDEEGNIYRGATWMSEVKVGRIESDGTLHKGANWFTEEKIGRIAEDGTIQKGSNWFNEEKQGRIGD